MQQLETPGFKHELRSCTIKYDAPWNTWTIRCTGHVGNNWHDWECKFGETGGCETAKVEEVGVGASTMIQKRFIIGTKSCDKQIPGKVVVIVLCSLCDLGDSKQVESAERIIRETIRRHRPDRNMTVLYPTKNDGDLNIDTSNESNPVRTWNEVVKTRIPIWQERLSLSKLYVGKKQEGLMIKVGLGISRTNADSQWNPVYNAFHRNCCCGNETIRRQYCKRDLEAANLRPALEQGCGKESKRQALGNYFSERICYMFPISKGKVDWDLGLYTTSVLAFRVPQRNEFDGVLQRNENPRSFEKYPTPP